jgi:hypothetical protein
MASDSMMIAAGDIICISNGRNSKLQTTGSNCNGRMRNDSVRASAANGSRHEGIDCGWLQMPKVAEGSCRYEHVCRWQQQQLHWQQL